MPHYVLFRAIYQFIAHFFIPFKVWITRLHLMHSRILSRAKVTPRAHIWSGRDLVMGCTFGLIRMTPLWRRELKHFHSPQVELYFSLPSFPICSSYSLNQRFPISPLCAWLSSWELNLQAKFAAEFTLLVIGLHNPLLTIKNFKLT